MKMELERFNNSTGLQKIMFKIKLSEFLMKASHLFLRYGQPPTSGDACVRLESWNLRPSTRLIKVPLPSYSVKEFRHCGRSFP